MNQKLRELGSYNSRKKRNERILKLLITSNMKSLSRIRLFATLWTVPYQAPQTIGFSRQEYWSGLPFPSPGDLPTQGSNRVSHIGGRRFNL